MWKKIKSNRSSIVVFALLLFLVATNITVACAPKDTSISEASLDTTRDSVSQKMSDTYIKAMSEALMEK